MTPPKFHVYLEYAQDPDKSAIRFNLSEEELVRTFVLPYTEKKPFWFCGKLLNPSRVDKTIIFWSYEDCGTLVLPNREMVAGHPNKKFAMDKICQGKVKGVSICTERFLPANQKTDMTSKRD
jgi:hypothetical protein